VGAHQLLGENNPSYLKHPAHTTQIDPYSHLARIVLASTDRFCVALDKPHGLSIHLLHPRLAARAAAAPPRRRLLRPSIHLSTAKGAHTVGDDDLAAVGGTASVGPYACRTCGADCTPARYHLLEAKSCPAQHAASTSASHRACFSAAWSSSPRRRMQEPMTRGRALSCYYSLRLLVHSVAADAAKTVLHELRKPEAGNAKVDAFMQQHNVPHAQVVRADARGRERRASALRAWLTRHARAPGAQAQGVPV
jgi:hypothetical protein